MHAPQRYEVEAWLGDLKQELDALGTLEDFMRDALADPEGDWIELLDKCRLPSS